MITTSEIKAIIRALGFVPEDGRDGVYIKRYKQHNSYPIRVNFNKKRIDYNCSEFNSDSKNTIKLGDSTTSHFKNSENFVVLECVNRLLEKGYNPSNIELEKKRKLGRNEKGKLDINITDNDGNSYIMIECKTWGNEFSKEHNKMLKDGGQLFSYYNAIDRSAKYLCLYSSHLDENSIIYKSEIIPVDGCWHELSTTPEIFDHWNKNFKDNGIFEDDIIPYNVEIKALTRGKLQPLTKNDSGKIFNQFAEILRHNVVSDKPNAFNKILNLFICKIIDEDKNDDEQLDFQWLDEDDNYSLQIRLNDLYKEGMYKFLDIDVTDFSEKDIDDKLINLSDIDARNQLLSIFKKLRLQKNPEFAFIEVYDDNSFELNARVVKEVVELLQPYQFRYGHKQQFLGQFFEKLLNTSMKQEAGQFFTPTPIAHYIISCFPIKEFIIDKIKTGKSDGILPSAIDFACGTGHFLTEYMDIVQSVIEDIDISNARRSIKPKLNYWRSEGGQYQWANEYVYGIDADYRLVKSAKVSSFLNGDGEANIIRANGLDSFKKSKDYKGKLTAVSQEDNKDNLQFDLLIANPPYSVNAFKATVKHGEESFELFNKLTEKSSEIECLFVERMKQLVKTGGYAGIILPNTILSNAGIYVYAREIILKYFNIVGVTEFGKNTFMATTTSTVALFLKRRSNSDWKRIEKAINTFFHNTEDVAVSGIENAFSKYVKETYDSISFDDYVSFVKRHPTETFSSLEKYKDYENWFSDLSEIKNFKNSKEYNALPEKDKQNKLNDLFFEKVFEIEKKKLLFFLLSFTNKTVIVKTGEKQEEKIFLGYEFSNSRGHEGIKEYSVGSKLFDKEDILNPEKANYYIYNAFKNEYLPVDETIENNITCVNTHNLIDFFSPSFPLTINLNSSMRLVFDTEYKCTKISDYYYLFKGITYEKEDQLYSETNNKILTADNINLLNEFEINKIVYLKESLKLRDEAKLSEDDIFICCSSGSRKHVGKVAFMTSNTEYYAGGFMGILRKKSTSTKLLPRYLFAILSSEKVQGFLSMSANGSNIINLNDNIVDIRIPELPIPLQRELISKYNKLEKRISDIQNELSFLEKELNNPQFYSFPKEKISRISIMLQRGKAAKYGDSSIQIIKSGQARGYLSFDFTNKYFVSKEFVSDERNLLRGDILINSTGVGTAGRVTLFDLNGEYVVDSHITILRIDTEKAIPKYVMYSLANYGFKNIEKLATGQSGQIELSYDAINNITISLPTDITIQKEIVAKMQTIENKITELKKEKKDLLEKKNAILDEYI